MFGKGTKKKPAPQTMVINGVLTGFAFPYVWATKLLLYPIGGAQLLGSAKIRGRRKEITGDPENISSNDRNRVDNHVSEQSAPSAGGEVEQDRQLAVRTNSQRNEVAVRTGQESEASPSEGDGEVPQRQTSLVLSGIEVHNAKRMLRHEKERRKNLEERLAVEEAKVREGEYRQHVWASELENRDRMIRCAMTAMAALERTYAFKEQECLELRAQLEALQAKAVEYEPPQQQVESEMELGANKRASSVVLTEIDGDEDEERKRLTHSQSERQRKQDEADLAEAKAQFSKMQAELNSNKQKPPRFPEKKERKKIFPGLVRWGLGRSRNSSGWQHSKGNKRGQQALLTQGGEVSMDQKIVQVSDNVSPLLLPTPNTEICVISEDAKLFGMVLHHFEVLNGVRPAGTMAALPTEAFQEGEVAKWVDGALSFLKGNSCLVILCLHSGSNPDLWFDQESFGNHACVADLLRQRGALTVIDGITRRLKGCVVVFPYTPSAKERWSSKENAQDSLQCMPDYVTHNLYCFQENKSEER
eukprot:TRINITY_DN17089_c0_g1_i1.p1 TRINITY_DN17089_c0_g1~~TRINITY_DN17089_c0_g1_i1.p1  ORF type:complete len:530 (+),score=106.79 TRINITY_DN17089_c0_g1_i1:362-1951(+)